MQFYKPTDFTMRQKIVEPKWKKYSERRVKSVIFGSEMPKVFLRVFPCFTAQVNTLSGNIYVKSSKVVSIVDNVQRKTTFCSYSQIFGEDTDQKHVFKDACLDPVVNFIKGGNSILLSYGKVNYQHYTMEGCEYKPGMVAHALVQMFDSWKGTISQDCTFRLSSNGKGAIKLKDDEKEFQWMLRNKLFYMKTKGNDCKQQKIFTSAEFKRSRNNIDNYEIEAKLDGHKNCVWVSSFIVTDDEVYDLLGGALKDEIPGLKHWLDKSEKIFPLSALCGNVFVVTPDEAYKLYLYAREIFECCLSSKVLSYERSIFVFCVINLVYRVDKPIDKIVGQTFACVSIPELPEKTLLSLGNNFSFDDPLVALWQKLKEMPTRQQPKDDENSLLLSILGKMWYGDTKISMIVNLDLDLYKYERVVSLLTLSCLKFISMDMMAEIKAPTLKRKIRDKRQKSKLKTEELADDMRWQSTLKRKEIIDKAKEWFQNENNGTVDLSGYEDPFLTFNIITDSSNRKRMTFPKLDEMLANMFAEEVEQVKKMKAHIMILKCVQSMLDEFVEQWKLELSDAQKVANRVKDQLLTYGKLTPDGKNSVISLIEKRIAKVISNPVQFRLIDEYAYILEVVTNDFEYF